MDKFDRALVSPGFMFSLWHFAKKSPVTEPHVELELWESPSVELVVVQGGLSGEVWAMDQAA
jgi:hypothetical protein